MGSLDAHKALNDGTGLTWCRDAKTPEDLSTRHPDGREFRVYRKPDSLWGWTAQVHGADLCGAYAHGSAHDALAAAECAVGHEFQTRTCAGLTWTSSTWRPFHPEDGWVAHSPAGARLFVSNSGWGGKWGGWSEDRRGLLAEVNRALDLHSEYTSLLRVDAHDDFEAAASAVLMAEAATIARLRTILDRLAEG